VYACVRERERANVSNWLSSTSFERVILRHTPHVYIRGKLNACIVINNMFFFFFFWFTRRKENVLPSICMIRISYVPRIYVVWYKVYHQILIQYSLIKYIHDHILKVTLSLNDSIAIENATTTIFAGNVYIAPLHTSWLNFRNLTINNKLFWFKLQYLYTGIFGIPFKKKHTAQLQLKSSSIDLKYKLTESKYFYHLHVRPIACRTVHKLRMVKRIQLH